MEESLENHGVTAPVGQAAWGGIHAVSDSQGNRKILVKLWTGTGSENQRRLLVIDAETGESQILMPPIGGEGAAFSGSFGTFLSSKNRFYNILQDGSGTPWIMEYDVDTNEWTASVKGPHLGKSGWFFANSFTEDDEGNIYAGMLPNGQLLKFDPNTKELKDLGKFGDFNHRTDPVIVTDDQGWIYAAMLYQEADILALKLGENNPYSLFSKEQKVAVTGVNMYRSKNGKVYAQYSGDKKWYELYEGKIKVVESPSGNIVLRRNGWSVATVFPDGSKITKISIPNKVATISNLSGKEKEIRFEYDSAGVRIMSLEAGPDAAIYGSTGIPLRFFRYDLRTGQMENWGLADNGGHVNDICLLGDKLYGGIYGTGSLFEYDPRQQWEDLAIGAGKNPKRIYHNQQYIGRPFALLAHPGGDHVLMGGNPYRGKPGGALVIHEVSSGKNILFEPEKLVDDQGIKSLAALPNGNVVIGTTTAPGTGGTRTAKEPYVLLFDWEKKEVVSKTAIEGSSDVADLLTLNETQVLGITPGNQPIVFVYDAKKGEVVGKTALSGFGSLSGSQGARVLSIGPDNQIYILFVTQIVRLNPEDLTATVVAKVPQEIATGAAWLEGRLYFASGSRLMSWKP